MDVDIDHYVLMCEGGEEMGFKISHSWQPAVVKKYSGRKRGVVGEERNENENKTRWTCLVKSNIPTYTTKPCISWYRTDSYRISMHRI